MYCKNCGTQLNDTALFCPNCGTAQSAQTQQAPQQPFAPAPAVHIAPRGIALAIVLSILTCGIYAIYWFVALTDEMNRLSPRPNDTSGGVAFLLNLITCGIYGYYWSYVMGSKQDQMNRHPNGSTGVLYLILSLFGLGIVVYALMQDAINKAVTNPQG